MMKFILSDEIISDTRWMRLFLSSGGNIMLMTYMNFMMMGMLMTVLVEGPGSKFANYWECNWCLLQVFIVGALDFILVIFIIIFN